MTGEGEWSGLTYGGIEKLIAGLQGTTAESVRTRFRKLRLRPFPDEIRSGTGVRIMYDLPRVLAIAAVFELNRLYIPQGQAAEMVERSWPEWCRAAISAACQLGLLPVPASMPMDATPTIRILPNAYRDADGGPEAMTFSQGGVEPRSEGEVPPFITVDLTRTVRNLVSYAGAGVDLTAAFASMERAFGWTSPPTPHRSSVAEMSRGRGFLDEGPFFARAEALLTSTAADFDGDARPVARSRLQWLFSYLEDPAPIDRWKAEIGSDENRPRLKHLLSHWAAERGLETRRSYPETAMNIAGEDVGEVALRYVREAQREDAVDLRRPT